MHQVNTIEFRAFKHKKLIYFIGIGLEPPARLLVHSHWTVDDMKMSKSKNNVVDPNEVAKTYTYEGLRYFLLREGVAHSDGSEFFVEMIGNENLIQTIFFRLQCRQSNTNHKC